ncbi:hypothetical protein [Croceicoccus gelatinilyticus]|uniref:hypothetical protein n=1 Tax=Croceicoccus gelatinilyticus TaxID=2835536 RepID=UPI001BCF22AC|nr:hypothetical protein [Croceicoccus gelatinilyticus]MBS7671366.1 hypothetical protein [Croceicoccus gelatinilyticus]
MGQSTGMTATIQKVLVAMSRRGAAAEGTRKLRQMVVGGAKLARNPAGLVKTLGEMSRIEELQAQEASTWLTPDALAQGEAGRFDSVDLRNWLVLAERAGVAAVPARPVLSLTEPELGSLLGDIDLHAHPRTARAADRISSALSSMPTAEVEAADPVDPADVYERCLSAMDDVPNGWMIRSHVCGSGDLKALACCGVAQDEAPEVRFSSDLEVGPGWVREGNRRRITFEDERTLNLYMHDTSVPLTFLARPWVRASHWYDASDPHREGTPLDVPGRWPAEWRAFVAGGKVTGVSIYYPHVDADDTRSIIAALEVRKLAQRIVDQAIADRQQARMMELAFLRSDPKKSALLDAAGMGDDDFACTLDFIETDDGIKLLEGGPPCSPFGGGHPCAFMGVTEFREIDGEEVEVISTEGIALHNGSGFAMRTPYGHDDVDAKIIGWDEAEARVEA